MHRELPAEEYRVEREPFYLPVEDEVEIFRAAFSCRLPVLLKGPTGCGKTRFVEYMAYQLGQTLQPSPNRGWVAGPQWPAPRAAVDHRILP